MIPFGKLKKSVSIMAAHSKTVATNKMASCVITRSCARIPIACYKDEVSMRNLIHDMLKIVVEFVFDFFVGMKGWGVQSIDILKRRLLNLE